MAQPQVKIPTVVREGSFDEPRQRYLGRRTGSFAARHRTMSVWRWIPSHGFPRRALIRLNEAGILAKLSRVSSVSGGSITAAVLGHQWKHLNFVQGVANNLNIVVDRVRQMADTNVDMGAVIGGILLPGKVSDRVSAAYDKVLFNGATLQDLPDDNKGEGPRFVINATNGSDRRALAILKTVYGRLPDRIDRQSDGPTRESCRSIVGFPTATFSVNFRLGSGTKRDHWRRFGEGAVHLCCCIERWRCLRQSRA
jgi:hypothetical protein